MNKGKTALITGASGGIGYEIAKLFAKDGINLVLAARRKELLQTIKIELEKQYGITVYCIDIDLSIQGKTAELHELCRIKNLRLIIWLTMPDMVILRRLQEVIQAPTRTCSI